MENKGFQGRVMKITNKTKIEKQAIQFLDGANGFFQRNYIIFVDDRKIDLIVQITGCGNKNPKCIFRVKNKVFQTAKEAFEELGYTWERTI